MPRGLTQPRNQCTWIGRGVPFATITSDAGLLQTGASGALREVREVAG
jgi:hypothetical protein